MKKRQASLSSLPIRQSQPLSLNNACRNTILAWPPNAFPGKKIISRPASRAAEAAFPGRALIKLLPPCVHVWPISDGNKSQSKRLAIVRVALNIRSVEIVLYLHRKRFQDYAAQV